MTQLDRGTYVLYLLLPRTTRIRIGALGAFDFPRGRYAYVGSAQNGLAARLARHLRDDKRLHWHIDYFLRHTHVLGIEVVRSARRLECQRAQELLRSRGACVIAPRFGASDCHCRAHLIYFGADKGGR